MKRRPRLALLAALAVVALPLAAEPARPTWMADNGDGSYTNPLFYDEFSDPDIIRVGDDYYLTGTTMHTMPGLPVLRSRDLVNWELVSYTVPELDLGPEYRLQGGERYGQGIWAPCLRFHDGIFHLFTNVNGRKTQLLRATDPAGPWTRTELGSSLHDLSVLFDDDGKIYVVWGYNEVLFAELKPDLSDIVPETMRVLIPAGSGAGEGSHFYKIDGRYYILGTNYDPTLYQVVARADRPEGPYEIVTASAGESFGVGVGYRLKTPARTPAGFALAPPQRENTGGAALHQGGLVQIQSGEWWAVSMMDHNSVGRLTCLSPVTWRDGWPLLGLPGNLTRSPLTWVKPATGFDSAPHAVFARSDDFSGAALRPVWQWNHVPDPARWSLSEKPGVLRLHALGAADFWTARNSLTQRAVGPESTATVELDAAGLLAGDTAGLALLNLPYAWIGVKRGAAGDELVWFDQTRGATRSLPLATPRVWLRAHCAFDTDEGTFAYSTDGATFQPFGDMVIMPYQLKTFQGVRFALFNFNTTSAAGGHADFDNFTVDEPRANPGAAAIPLGKTITLTAHADGRLLAVWNGLLRAGGGPAPLWRTNRFVVLDRGQGRVALQAADGSGFVTVTGAGEAGDLKLIATDRGDAATFQWTRTEAGDVMLLSLVTQRYVAVEPWANGLLSAQARGIAPLRDNGASFDWREPAE